MPLPNADQAQIPDAKLRDYVLNPMHTQGGPKARVFAAALGIAQADWRYLRDQLLGGVRAAEAERRESTEWGDLYETVIEVVGQSGHVHKVRADWIIRVGDPRPHLVTAYVDLS